MCASGPHHTERLGLNGDAFHVFDFLLVHLVSWQFEVEQLFENLFSKDKLKRIENKHVDFVYFDAFETGCLTQRLKTNMENKTM